jgi:hypothetical protein
VNLSLDLIPAKLTAKTVEKAWDQSTCRRYRFSRTALDPVGLALKRKHADCQCCLGLGNRCKGKTWRVTWRTEKGNLPAQPGVAGHYVRRECFKAAVGPMSTPATPIMWLKRSW